MGKGGQGHATREVLERLGLNTVCVSARCLNRGECYASQTATFLIMGRRCTRNCRFCAVDSGPPEPLDPDEPRRLALAALELGLRYVVITSVTRDDLPDGGAAHFAQAVRAVRSALLGAGVEVLTPDFGAQRAPLAMVLAACPTVFNHNLETVARLRAAIRPQASYEVSLRTLESAGELAPQIPRKSGLMLGLGESDEEVRAALGDLRAAGVSLLTLGQYVQPTRDHWPVHRYLAPDAWGQYQAWGRELGFEHVAAGPFVRSSYRAAEGARAAGGEGRTC